MDEEIKFQRSDDTWELVPCPSDSNIVGSKWVFRTKLHSDRTIDRYKACFVYQGFTVVPETDYTHTFSPIVFSSSTIIIVFSLATIYRCLLHQLDVKNVFLHGNRNELVYMEQPPDFIAPARPNRVCKLKQRYYMV